MRRLKPIEQVTVNVHRNLYMKMEEIRKQFRERNGINLSQVQVTNIMAKRIRPINKIDIIGGQNVKTIRKKRRPY